jgi:gluconokinase
MPLIVVMGVSGCGKSSMGEALSSRLGLPFIEGDALHPETNIAKMSAGIPLTDEDRWPWLETVGSVLREYRETGGAIVACSALKKAYRDALRQAAGGELVFVFMSGSRALLEDRMRVRSGHFMPASLLDSQLATLESPGRDEDAIVVDCAEPLESAANRVAATVSEPP